MLRGIETASFWAGVTLYVISFLLYLTGAIFKKDRQLAFAWKACIYGFILITVAIAVRWVESGHAPVLLRFEHALAGSWFIVLFFLLMGWRLEGVRRIGIVVVPFVLLMIGYGVMSKESGIQPLPPPYQSGWLWVHVTFGWVTYGAYHVAAGMAILFLVKRRALNKKPGEISKFLVKLPDLHVMDNLTFKLIIYGFIAHIVMIGSGAIWAYGLWSRYWGWDPIETWSLISWLTYGLNIHLRATYGWRDNKAAWLAILSLSGVLIFFGGIGFTKGVHTPLL